MALLLVAALLFHWRPRPLHSPPSELVSVRFEQELLALHNLERINYYRPAYRLNFRLSQAAQGHAEWMHDNYRMTHRGNGTFVTRIRAAGYVMSSGGENVAFGFRTPKEVMESWLESPGHRDNILNRSWVDIGLGHSGGYWCAVFAAPAK